MSLLWLLVLVFSVASGFAAPEDVSVKDKVVFPDEESQITTETNPSEIAGDQLETTTEATIKLTPGADVHLTRLDVTGLVRHRYATIEVQGIMVNRGDASDESHFVVHLPESAFVSRATLDVDGRRMDGEVREKKTAQQEYQQAVDAGLAAGHVATVRDSNQVRVSVNLPPGAQAIFNLTYEELLFRRKGRYEITLNLSPEQPAEHVTVDIKIRESSNLTFVRVPPFDSPLTLDGNDNTQENKAVRVTWPEESNVTTKARVQYDAQGDAAALPGPLIVRYDVDHTSQGGEVLLMEGYFVHFLAATPERDIIEPLPKHAVFILDSSGSMWGRKLQQLKSAMAQILGQLRRHDVFSIVTFSTTAAEWSTPGLEPAAGKGVYLATRRNVALAQEFINRMEASGATNIQSALRRALVLAARYRNATIPGLKETNATSTPTEAPVTDSKFPQPVLMFLTDGMPTAGELRLNRILNLVKFFNQASKANIFALAFGDGANLGFLRKLSLQNSGFSRRIYEAADSAVQLQSFYQEIASPLLTNLNFTYVESKVNLSSVTERLFPTLFAGSEAVVAGRLTSDSWNEIPTPSFNVIGHVTAQSSSQILEDVYMPSAFIERSKHEQDAKKRRPGHLERAWAYLRVRQLLDSIALEQIPDEDPSDNNITAPTPAPMKIESEYKAIARALSLKYGFVTPLTSLVLVERNAVNGTTKEATVELLGGNVDSELSGGMKAQDKIMPASIPFRPGLKPLPGISPIAQTTSKPTTVHTDVSGNWMESLPWLIERLQDNDQLVIDIDNVQVNRTVVRDPSQSQREIALPCSENIAKYGKCRHLAVCHAQVATYQNFIERFCDIEGQYVGVCC